MVAAQRAAVAGGVHRALAGAVRVARETQEFGGVNPALTVGAEASVGGGCGGFGKNQPHDVCERRGRLRASGEGRGVGFVGVVRIVLLEAEGVSPLEPAAGRPPRQRRRDSVYWRIPPGPGGAGPLCSKMSMSGVDVWSMWGWCGGWFVAVVCSQCEVQRYMVCGVCGACGGGGGESSIRGAGNPFNWLLVKY